MCKECEEYGREEWEDVRDEEIAKAATAGLPWTPWREMFPNENIGAMRCGAIGRRHRKSREAIYVKYATGAGGGFAHGRIVLCEECFSRRKAKKK